MSTIWRLHYGKTAKEKRQTIGDANAKDNRKQEMDSRVIRSWMFDNITMYRASFLRDSGIRHYENPGYGRQDDAFRFLAMAVGRPLILDEVLYERRLDAPGRMNDAKIVGDVCEEFRYLEKRLKEDGKLWWKMRLVFWQAYYDRNRLLYESLSDDLRSRLSRRMQADISGVIRRGEYSREHFDVVVRDEMELLLKSADEFDRYMGNKFRQRDQMITKLRQKEDRLAASIRQETDIERLSRETAERTRQEMKKKRLDRAWLLDEMSRDMAPLRMLLGLTAEEMGNILGVSGSTYKSMEAGKKEVSWDQYMALLFIFRYNNRTADVTDTLGLYPDL